MSLARRQVLISASPTQVWNLVGDPERHPEWWPRVVRVRGERFDEGDNFAQVTKNPGGSIETTISIDRLDDLHEIHMRCTQTGTYTRWLLTEAQGATFVEAEFGMDPVGVRYRVFDTVIGRLYFSRWLDESVSALEAAARETGSAQG